MNSNIYIAKGAHVIGDVTMEENVNIWYNTVVRADNGPITIGENTNIQDNSTVHVEPNGKVVIGKNVNIGHNALLHGCTIGDNTLIGMGTIIISGAVIGKNCLIGSGSLITGKTVIPDNSVAFGNPAKVVRQIKESEIQDTINACAHYVHLAKTSMEYE